MTQPLYGGLPSSSSIKRRRQLADALLSNATDASPVGHWTQALARGLQGGIAGWQNRRADKEEGARSQALADALQGGKMSPEGMQDFGLTNDMPDVTQVGTSRMKAADNNSKYGNSFYTVKGPNGELRYIQPFSGGGAQEVTLPPGFQPSETINYLNQGTQFGGMGSKSGQPGPVVPINNAAEAEQKAYGKGMGDRTVDQPNFKLATDTAVNSLGQLKQAALELKSSPGFAKIFGMMSMVPNMPGGEAANAQAKLDLLKNKVFGASLQALRDASKTGGAVGNVSNLEGARFENMLVALSQTQDAAQAAKMLDEIGNYADGATQRLNEAYNSMYGNGKGAAAGEGAATGDDTYGNNMQMIQKQAQEAIAAGADPEQVNARLRELMGQQQ